VRPDVDSWLDAEFALIPVQSGGFGMRRFDGCMFRILRGLAPCLRRFLPVRGYRNITLPDRGPCPDGKGAGCRTMPRVDLAAHPTTCAKLLIIYPGLNATLDGESRHFTEAHPFRYRRLAQRMQSEQIAAVVRVANPACGYYGNGQVAVDRLRRAIDYALEYARALCGDRHPALYVMGFSAGAGAAAALAGDYQPKAMLLIAPSGDVGPRRIIAGLKEYTGRLVLLVGEKDEVVGRDAARLFDEVSPAARSKQVLLVPDCDHFFTRGDHDRLFEETSLSLFSEPEMLQHEVCL
jgi:alpha/beta superfamily hydrolase